MAEETLNDRWLIISADLSELKQVRKILADSSVELFTATNPETGLRLIRFIRRPIRQILIGQSISGQDFAAIQSTAHTLSYPVSRFFWSAAGELKTE